MVIVVFLHVSSCIWAIRYLSNHCSQVLTKNCFLLGINMFIIRLWCWNIRYVNILVETGTYIITYMSINTGFNSGVTKKIWIINLWESIGFPKRSGSAIDRTEYLLSPKGIMPMLHSTITHIMLILSAICLFFSAEHAIQIE